MSKLANELALVLQPMTKVGWKSDPLDETEGAQLHNTQTRMTFSEVSAEHETERTASDLSAKQELFLAASKGDRQAKSELSGAVIREVNINILGQLFASSFFANKTYGPADWPVIRTKLYDKNFFVTSVGINGGNPMKQHVEAVSDYLLNFGYWATDDYEFAQYNLQTGPLNYFGEALARIQYELGLHMDQVARDFLRANAYFNGTPGFTFGGISGSSAALTTLLNLHPSINATNIPPANGLDMSGVGTAGRWSMEKIKRILDYCVRWTADVQPRESGSLSGPLEVRAVHCSSQRKRDLWDLPDMVALVSTTIPGEPSAPATAPTQTITEEARGQIWRSGRIDEFFGQPCPIVPNNTLAANEVYVAFNRPAGTFHSKPSFDSTVHNQSPELAKKNAESVWMKKCGVFSMENDTISNFLQIRI